MNFMVTEDERSLPRGRWVPGGPLHSSVWKGSTVAEALSVMCPMDSTMGIGNVQNATKGLILWHHFWQDLLEIGTEKSDLKFS